MISLTAFKCGNLTTVRCFVRSGAGKEAQATAGRAGEEAEASGLRRSRGFFVLVIYERCRNVSVSVRHSFQCLECFLFT